jgi:hypothetical protein
LTKFTHSQGASNLSPASSLTRLERKSKQLKLQQQLPLAPGGTVCDRTQTSLESSDSLTAADVSGHILSTDENVI